MIPFEHKNGPLKIDSKLIHKIPTYFIENQFPKERKKKFTQAKIATDKELGVFLPNFQSVVSH